MILRDADAAIELLRVHCIPVFREIGDQWGECSALGVLSDALHVAGRSHEARAALAECWTIAVALDDAHCIATALVRRAVIEFADGRAAAGEAAAMDAADRMQQVGGTVLPWITTRLQARRIGDV